MKLNKKKIINDPIYGFVRIPFDLMHDIIQTPIFQRLRRIKQMGLTFYTYPGATHTRFQHSLGASYLMEQALTLLSSKGVEISELEYQSAVLAILLHDVGHAPFSHTLENSLLKNISHETISLYLMKKLNDEFSGQLQTAIEIFTNQYGRKFFHQLVSSQLDMDRLDYLKRDSYYSGVVEGMVASDRIIKMLNVADNQLVLEEKSIYSIENFLISRRLMYWQVYLHKTVVASEQMLIKIMQRAKEIYREGRNVFLSPALQFFFDNDIESEASLFTEINGQTPLDAFIKLDDSDIISCVKEWQFCDDEILSYLSKSLINRKLFKCKIQEQPFGDDEISTIKARLKDEYNLSGKELEYFFIHDTISNNAYSKISGEQINLIDKNGNLQDVAVASDISNLETLSKIVTKFFICYPR